MKDNSISNYNPRVKPGETKWRLKYDQSCRRRLRNTSSWFLSLPPSSPASNKINNEITSRLPCRVGFHFPRKCKLDPLTMTFRWHVKPSAVSKLTQEYHMHPGFLFGSPRYQTRTNIQRGWAAVLYPRRKRIRRKASGVKVRYNGEGEWRK